MLNPYLDPGFIRGFIRGPVDMNSDPAAAACTRWRWAAGTASTGWPWSGRRRRTPAWARSIPWPTKPSSSPRFWWVPNSVHNAVTALEIVVHNAFTALEFAVHNAVTDLEPTVNNAVTDLEPAVHNAATDLEPTVHNAVTDLEPTVNNAFTDLEPGVYNAFTNLEPAVHNAGGVQEQADRQRQVRGLSQDFSQGGGTLLADNPIKFCLPFFPR